MVDQDLLDQVQNAQGPNNADLAGAVQQSQWANTFSNIPSAEVQRSQLNLSDTIKRATDNRMTLEAQKDVHALDLMRKTAEFKEWQDQAPQREALIKARTEAAGASTRLQAFKDQREAEHTANLSNGLLQLHQSGIEPGSPEEKVATAELLLKNPYAHAPLVKSVTKDISGEEPMTPEEAVSKASEVLTAARDKLGPTAQVEFRKGIGFVPKTVKADRTEVEELALSKARVQGGLEAKIAAGVPLTPGGRASASVAAEKNPYREFNDQLHSAKVAYGVIDESGQPIAKNPGKLPDFVQEAFDARGKQIEEAVQKNGIPPVAGAGGKPIVAGTLEAPIRVDSREQYDALPKGAHYVDSHGKVAKKQ